MSVAGDRLHLLEFIRARIERLLRNSIEMAIEANELIHRCEAECSRIGDAANNELRLAHESAGRLSDERAGLERSIALLDRLCDEEMRKPKESVLAQLPKEYLATMSEPVSVASWSHAICDVCWRQLEGSRTPVRCRKPEEAPSEQCCWCGSPSKGIYYRKDPRELRCKGAHS